MKNKQEQQSQPSEDNLEVADVENYRGDKMLMFNHQSLVMSTMGKCIEAGSHEMRPGYTNRKTDAQGNTVVQYVEDTREKFIESVRTAEMIMISDYDGEATKKISGIKKQLKEIRATLLRQQLGWFNSLDERSKEWARNKYGEITLIGFNAGLDWVHLFIEKKLEGHRLIFEQLTLLTKRLDYYQQEDFTG